jgi:hypothetical protein
MTKTTKPIGISGAALLQADFGERECPFKAKFEGKLTWCELVKREPELRTLFEKAKAVDDSDPHFCANRVWYRHFKPVLCDLVGWDARVQDGVVNSSEAYDIAYRKIYQALPDCKDCACIDFRALTNG